MKQKNTSKKIKKSQALWRHAQEVMLGGVSLLSKKPERFLREGWPVYFTKAKGIEVWDLDGNHYKDFSYMGVGPNLLGYADREVDAAVKKVINAGNQSTLNSPEEVELADLLLKLHPWAAQVRYARSGGEIAAIAVRIARAHSGRDKVAFCGYHGWHDWYLATNLAKKKNLDGHLLPGLQPLGVPRALSGSALPFSFNKIEELEALVRKHKDIGVIAMEPMRHHEPEHNFLKKVRTIADRIGAVLIFDEISSGFRLGFPGAHTRFGVIPDIAIYSKAISNGYPMAALVGKKKVMREAHASFISSTYHSERIGPAAALATLRKLERVHIDQYVERVGWLIGREWQRLAKKHELPIVVEGPGAFINFTFTHPDAQALKALFTQEMLRYEYLATPTMYVSYAHKPADIVHYAKAVDAVFGSLAEALRRGVVHRRLRGGLPESGFVRLT
ncbi:MAG: aminotransferase class III-fold pyridoxal phosphate-dependent enzyme [bacterium]|nr:aminotransferase class III-fold pyridoxal phosphate-dependent enzyme [bacterium]